MLLVTADTPSWRKAARCPCALGLQSRPCWAQKRFSVCCTEHAPLGLSEVSFRDGTGASESQRGLRRSESCPFVSCSDRSLS